MAEAKDIALVAAVLGARSRFEAGIVAIGFEQQGSVGKCRTAVDEGRVHASPLTRCSFPFRAQTRSTNRQPCSRTDMPGACRGREHRGTGARPSNLPSRA